MESFRLAILSDVHYASAAEQARHDYFSSCIKNPLHRWAVGLYRHYYWQRDPFVHNYLLDDFIEQNQSAQLVIAIGDYSCDSGFVGLSDDAAFASAAECVHKLRAAFKDRFIPTLGDHELGKKPLGADLGGLRLQSIYRAETELQMKPFWRVDLGNYVLLGIMSTLVAWPVYASEASPSERPQWEKIRAEHMEQIRQAFASLQPSQRVLLFCHDPTALPFLYREPVVQEKLSQIERTLIGHLHSPWFLFKSRILSGMPVIKFLGHTPKRLSSALREARYWKPFNLLLCPSLSGIEILKDGGYFTALLSPDGQHPAQFRRHYLPRHPLPRTPATTPSPLTR